jgi:hypothetical protein
MSRDEPAYRQYSALVYKLALDERLDFIFEPVKPIADRGFLGDHRIEKMRNDLPKFGVEDFYLPGVDFKVAYFGKLSTASRR